MTGQIHWQLHLNEIEWDSPIRKDGLVFNTAEIDRFPRLLSALGKCR